MTFNEIVASVKKRVQEAKTKRHLSQLIKDSVADRLKRQPLAAAFVEPGKEKPEFYVMANVQDIQAENPGELIICGASSGSVNYKDYAASELHICTDPDGEPVKVTAGGHAFVIVNVYGDSHVIVAVKDAARVCILHTGSGRNITSSAAPGATLHVKRKK